MLGLSRKRHLYFLGIVSFFATIVIIYSGVDNSLTNEDLEYIPKFLDKIEPLPKNKKFGDELEFIKLVQNSVITHSSDLEGIPFNSKREPKDLYTLKIGLCYDNSRVIEKILRFSNFQTRHISVYSKIETGSGLKSLLTPGISSHAITEVLTSGGWLVVDSIDPWVSINKSGQPVSIEKIWSMMESSGRVNWKTEPPSEIYREPFTFVYGLYSRHGKFYPPYNLVPDINFKEFYQNL